MSRAHGRKVKTPRDLRVPAEYFPGYYSVEDEKEKEVEIHIKSGRTTFMSFTGKLAMMLARLTDEQILQEARLHAMDKGKTLPKNTRVERISS